MSPKNQAQGAVGPSWRAKIHKAGVLSVPPQFGTLQQAPGYIRDIVMSLPVSFTFDVLALVPNQDIALSVPIAMGGVPPDVATGALTVTPGFRGDVAEFFQDVGDVGLTVTPSVGGDAEQFERGFPYTFPFTLAEDGTPSGLPLPGGWDTDESLTAQRVNDIATVVNSLGDATTLIPRYVQTSGAATLTLTTAYNTYVFTGTSSTWTLPAVSGNTGKWLYLDNRGSAAVTVNRAGSDQVFDGVPRTSLTMVAGRSIALVDDSVYWVAVDK